ncbi:MAG: 30S ribosomal protein S12 methylthiotransferase RimO [Deltaproteobacteria bacterium]|nr:30S ribosomal protein S12 methylthiotransferase RimO [Candidatus Zymogenaceae bacterium]
MPTYCIIALGCDKNIIDAEMAAKSLIDAGYAAVPAPDEADIVIVHTCAFIDEAKEESISMILEAAGDKKAGAALVVSGCLAQRYAAQLAEEMPEVDLFVGVGRHDRILDLLGSTRISVGSPMEWSIDTRNRIPSTPPWSAYIKISEGCDNRCSYCVIPSIRGGLRSRPIAHIVEEIQWLQRRGMVELNLIAQDVAAYGADMGMKEGLARLLTTILAETDVPWIRLLYLHPRHITDTLIDLVAGQDRILNYLDIPVQHISDPILSAMERKIDRATIVSLIKKVRERIGGLFLRTSLIVGFPGEGEREFGDLMDFVAKTRFEHIGVFRYSREEKTGAASLPGRVPKKTAKKRHDMIMSLQEEISHDHNRNLVGKVGYVLLEGPYGEDEFCRRGRFYGQAPEVDGIVVVSGTGAGPGELVAVRFTDAYPYDLAAKAL